MDWYPDPADPTRERYWDGERWTHNTRAAQQAPLAPTQPVADPWSAQDGPQAGVAQPGQGDYGPYQGAAPQQGNPYQANPYAAGPHSQYDASGAGKQTHTADGVPLASWGSRVIAYLLDGLVLGALTMLLGWNFWQRAYQGYMDFVDDMMAQASGGGTMPPPDVATLEKYDIMGPMYALQAISLAVMLGYLVLCWKFMGATLGQRLMGMRVVPVDRGQAPRPLGWGATLVRALVFSFSGLLWFVQLISFVMPLFTRRRQTLHDMAARTQVVKGR